MPRTQDKASRYPHHHFGSTLLLLAPQQLSTVEAIFAIGILIDSSRRQVLLQIPNALGWKLHCGCAVEKVLITQSLWGRRSRRSCHKPCRVMRTIFQHLDK